MATQAQRRAVARYNKANVKQVPLKLNVKTDADIIEWLAEQPSRQGYIKALIRADMAAKAGKQGE